MQPQNWNATIIAAMKNTYLAGVDALQSNFFWTWKIGSTTAYANPAPAWSYKLGLQMGWIPNDPREAIGYCESNNLVPSPTAFTGYQPFMTGGVGAGTIPAAASSQYAWPLTQLVSSVSAGTALFYAQTDLSRLPQYTRTAAPMSAPTPTFTDLPSSISSQLVPTASLAPQSAFTAVAGCTYPNEYSGNGIPIPTSACGAGQSASQAFYKRAQITAAPQA
jgi:glucan 1,3-beta-glucosidase